MHVVEKSKTLVTEVNNITLMFENSDSHCLLKNKVPTTQPFTIQI